MIPSSSKSYYVAEILESRRRSDPKVIRSLDIQISGVVTLNVVVIVTDSLRVDHVGCYGSGVETPNIDGLAEEGTTFEQVFSEGLPTLRTRTTWWTGRYTFSFRRWQPFGNSDLLLVEVLWNRGYESALISDTYHMHEPIYNCVGDSTEKENLVDGDRDIVASLDREPRRFVDEVTPHDAALYHL